MEQTTVSIVGWVASQRLPEFLDLWGVTAVAAATAMVLSLVVVGPEGMRDGWAQRSSQAIRRVVAAFSRPCISAVLLQTHANMDMSEPVFALVGYYVVVLGMSMVLRWLPPRTIEHRPSIAAPSADCANLLAVGFFIHSLWLEKRHGGDPDEAFGMVLYGSFWAHLALIFGGLLVAEQIAGVLREERQRRTFRALPRSAD